MHSMTALVMVGPMGEGIGWGTRVFSLSLCWRDGARSTSHARGPWVVSQVASGASDGTRPVDLDSVSRLHGSIGACRSRTYANDRLPVDPLGRVEGGDGVVERR